MDPKALGTINFIVYRMGLALSILPSYVNFKLALYFTMMWAVNDGKLRNIIKRPNVHSTDEKNPDDAACLLVNRECNPR